MMLRPFSAGDTWDRVAAGQMLCVLIALYRERRVAIEALIGDDASIVHVQFYDNFSWPPAWVIIKQADAYYVVWCGTTNLRQLGGHIYGSFLYHGVQQVFHEIITQNDGAPNGAWKEMVDTYWPDIRSHLPADLSQARLFFSGHSYGAAIAQLAAVKLMEDEGVEAQLLTFGQPRVWTKGYKGKNPRVCWLLASPNDPVFASPGDVDIIWFGIPGLPILGGGLSQVYWEHVGQVEFIGADGSADPKAPAPYPLPPKVSTSFIGEHSTSNYFGRVKLSYARQQAGG